MNTLKTQTHILFFIFTNPTKPHQIQNPPKSSPFFLSFFHVTCPPSVPLPQFHEQTVTTASNHHRSPHRQPVQPPPFLADAPPRTTTSIYPSVDFPPPYLLFLSRSISPRQQEPTATTYLLSSPSRAHRRLNISPAKLRPSPYHSLVTPATPVWWFLLISLVDCTTAAHIPLISRFFRPWCGLDLPEAMATSPAFLFCFGISTFLAGVNNTISSFPSLLLRRSKSLILHRFDPDPVELLFLHLLSGDDPMVLGHKSLRAFKRMIRLL